MREIKFRGMSDRTSKFSYGSYVKTDFALTGAVIAGGNGFGHVEVNPKTVGQYTGLKDKNGVEIYEGDICSIRYYTPFGDKTDDYYGEYLVKKWMGQFILLSQTENERLSFIDFADTTSSKYVSNVGTVCEFSNIVNVKVIGNIHQNPELLK